MNTFPRYSLFQNHLISSLPNLYRCSECNGQLIYACGQDNEQITCATYEKHMGLVDVEDIALDINERLTAQGTHEYEILRSLDPTTASFLREKRRPSSIALFGDPNEF